MRDGEQEGGIEESLNAIVQSMAEGDVPASHLVAENPQSLGHDERGGNDEQVGKQAQDVVFRIYRQHGANETDDPYGAEDGAVLTGESFGLLNLASVDDVELRRLLLSVHLLFFLVLFIVCIHIFICIFY